MPRLAIGYAAHARMIVVLLPVGAELPLILGLTCSERLADLDLVKTRATRHGILIRDHVAACPQAPLVAPQTQHARDCETTPVGKAGKVHADDFCG